MIFLKSIKGSVNFVNETRKKRLLFELLTQVIIIIRLFC